jgi:hypothetical protein
MELEVIGDQRAYQGNVLCKLIGQTLMKLHGCADHSHLLFKPPAVIKYSSWPCQISELPMEFTSAGGLLC